MVSDFGKTVPLKHVNVSQPVDTHHSARPPPLRGEEAASLRPPRYAPLLMKTDLANRKQNLPDAGRGGGGCWGRRWWGDYARDVEYRRKSHQIRTNHHGRIDDVVSLGGGEFGHLSPLRLLANTTSRALKDRGIASMDVIARRPNETTGEVICRTAWA